MGALAGAGFRISLVSVVSNKTFWGPPGWVTLTCFLWMVTSELGEKPVPMGGPTGAGVAVGAGLFTIGIGQGAIGTLGRLGICWGALLIGIIGAGTAFFMQGLTTLGEGGPLGLILHSLGLTRGMEALGAVMAPW